MGKGEYCFFFKTFAAYEFKAGRCIQLNEATLSYISIKGQDHYMTLAKGYSDFKSKSCFYQKLFGHLQPNFMRKLMESQE